MLELFRTNQLAISILLLFYVFLVRFPVFIVPDTYVVVGAGIWSVAIYDMVGGSNGWIPDLIAVVLLFFQAVYLNQIIYKHRLARTPSLFPGVFYVITASLVPEFNHLSPLLLANTFYIIALGELMEIYKRKTCADRIFNIGFWLGIASLFYFSYLVFLLLGVVGIFVMRAMQFSELLTLISGSVVAYFLAGAYYFWDDRLDEFLQVQLVDSIAFLDVQIAAHWESYVTIGIVALLILIIFTTYSSHTIRRNIQTQKRISVISWGIAIAVLSFLLQHHIQIDHLLIFAVPIGVFLSFSFINMPARWAETLHLLLLVAIIVWQFKSFYLMS